MDENEEGWGEEILDNLYEVFEKIDSLTYEVRHCVRGCYTRCTTNGELADYLRSLAGDLETAAGEIK